MNQFKFEIYQIKTIVQSNPIQTETKQMYKK